MDKPRRNFGEEIEQLDRMREEGSLDRRTYLDQKEDLIRLWSEQADGDDISLKEKKLAEKQASRDALIIEKEKKEHERILQVEFILQHLKKVLFVEESPDSVKMYFVHGVISRSQRAEPIESAQTTSDGIEAPLVVYQIAFYLKTGVFKSPGEPLIRKPSELAAELSGGFTESKPYELFNRQAAQDALKSYFIKNKMKKYL